MAVRLLLVGLLLSMGGPNVCWFPHGTTVTSGCPQVVDGGCAASPGGDFQQANFSTHARQSGQTWTSAHPWNWNSCGIDYPCGYFTATASLKDPAVTNPTGCTYSATGNTAGGPIETCSAATVDIEGFDFSLHNCVPIEITSGVTSITIKNNKLFSGSNCVAENKPGFGSFIVLVDSSASANVDFESNHVDGGGSPGTTNGTGTCLLFQLANGKTITVKYNAILNCNNQPIAATHTNPFLSEFNYIENFVFNTGLHGEYALITFASGTQASTQSSYDTCLQGSGVEIAGSTACITPGPVQPGGAVTSSQVDHDVLVMNLNAGQQTTSAGVEAGQATYTNGPILTNNYIDQEALGQGFYELAFLGGGSCGTPSTLSGNVRLTTGVSINTYSVNNGTGC